MKIINPISILVIGLILGSLGAVSFQNYIEENNQIAYEKEPEDINSYISPKMDEYELPIWIYRNTMNYEVCIRTKDKSNLYWIHSNGTSMQPISVNGSIIIYTKDFDIEDLIVGTAIIWENPYDNELIFHRIYELHKDEKGWYAITKGDNINGPDPIKIRKEYIKGVKVGII